MERWTRPTLGEIVVHELPTPSRTRTVLRRTVSTSALFVAWLVLIVGSPAWILVGLLVDLGRRRWRFPLVRLFAFAVCWSTTEILGVLAASALWCVGRAKHQDSNYALQRWWANALMTALRVTCGVTVEVGGDPQLPEGPMIVLSRHVSLADSLVSAWVLGNKRGRRPRYVLKKELAFDPCLDIVGHRLPNHFVDRESPNLTGESSSLSALATDLGPSDAVVIFPEGTRSNDSKRARRLAELGERNPARASRLGGLRFLLPPKPAGVVSLLAVSEHANVVVCAHVGFDGMDSFKGMIKRFGEAPVRSRFDLRLVPRPDNDPVEWLDSLWVQLDDRVAAMETMK